MLAATRLPAGPACVVVERLQVDDLALIRIAASCSASSAHLQRSGVERHALHWARIFSTCSGLILCPVRRMYSRRARCWARVGFDAAGFLVDGFFALVASWALSGGMVIGVYSRWLSSSKGA